MKTLWEKYYGLLPLLLLCLFCIVESLYFGAHDFANYYFGGWAVTDGSFNPYIYFPYQFNRLIASQGHPGIFASYAPNTPFLALLFVPLSLLSLATAKLIFNCISVILLIYGLQRLASYYRIKSVYLMVVPVLFFVPIRNSLLFGQVYFLLFFLLSESWLAYKRKEFIKMAAFLGPAIVLKIFPALVIVFLLFRKQFRPAIYAGVSCVVFLLLSVYFTGIEIWRFYFTEVLPKASNGEIATAFVVNYQSVLMLLKQLFVFESTANPGALFHSPALFSALLLGFKIKLLAIGYYLSQKRTNSLFIFSYWIMAAILISPYGSTYTFILMLFPYLAVAKSHSISDTKKAVYFGLLLLICNLPVSLFSGWVLPFSYLRLLLVLVFFGVLVLSFRKKIHFTIVSAVVIVPMLLVFFLRKETPDTLDYALPANSPVLVYDYKIANNTLTYSYRDETGENVQSLAFPASVIQPLKVTGNQIYHQGRQLTFDSDHKEKPVLINNRTLVYLSDKDRGIGFFTIRKRELKSPD